MQNVQLWKLGGFTMLNESFPLRLKKARNAHGFTQIEVAKELLLNRVNLSRYETGAVEPDIETIAQLADFYGVTTDWLIGRVEKTDKNPVSTWDRQQGHTESFPDKLKKARKKTGMSQEKVAKILKMSKSNIAKYELGQLQPSLETLIRLTVFYGVTSDWLLGLTEDNPAF